MARFQESFRARGSFSSCFRKPVARCEDTHFFPHPGFAGPGKRPAFRCTSFSCRAAGHVPDRSRDGAEKEKPLENRISSKGFFQRFPSRSQESGRNHEAGTPACPPRKTQASRQGREAGRLFHHLDVFAAVFHDFLVPGLRIGGHVGHRDAVGAVFCTLELAVLGGLLDIAVDVFH